MYLIILSKDLQVIYSSYYSFCDRKKEVTASMLSLCCTCTQLGGGGGGMSRQIEIYSYFLL